MTHPVPEHFAQTLLDTHAHEGTFVVGIPDDEDASEVARAFEVLGCTVEPDPFDLSLRITVLKAA